MHAPLPTDRSAPVAPRRPTVRTHHGDAFEDPYEWLRDKDDPEVIAYLEAENAYTEAQTSHLTELADAVFDEIKARTKETDLTVPSYATHRGGSAYWYYARTVEGSEYPIYCRVPATDRRTPPDAEAEIPGEEVLLDGNVEAAGHEFFSIGAFSFSPDGRLLAYSRRPHRGRAVHPADQGPDDRRAAARPDPRHRVRGGLGPQRPPLLHPRRPGLAAVRRPPAPAGHRPGRPTSRC